jgi:hypothetical protein
MPILPRIILFSTFCLASSLSAQGLAWQSSLDAALQFAKKTQRVLLVAVVMPGERGSDGIIAHYKDSRVRKLSTQCVCFRIDVGTSRPSADEREVLQSYLGAAPRDPIVVPHHVIVHPDGKQVLSSAAYQMTAGQLEWFIVDGIKQFDPTFEWMLSERSRAPEGLRYGDVQSTEEEVTPPPTRAEVKKAIETLKKGGSGWQGSVESYNVLLRSDESAAIKYVEAQLQGGRGFLTRLAIAQIGAVSPVAWSPILVDFLSNRNDSRREDAAKGLANMAHSKTNKAIKKQLKAEKKPSVKAWLIRAAVATAPKDKATISAIDKALSKDKDANVRMHAAVAAGALEEKDAAHRLMRKAMSDSDPDVRSAAAYAMAARRDKEMMPTIEATIETEPDAETKHWMELALDTLLNNKDLREFENFRKKVLKEGVQRDNGGNNNQGGRQPGGRRNGG